MLSLSVRAVCAPEAVGDCKRHAAAHARVLELHGFGNATSAKQAWWQNRNTYALLVEDVHTKEPMGGVRLQRWGNRIALPMESALSSIDARVHAWVASYADHGVGELCGLWCSPKLQGFRLSSCLTEMGLSLASRVGTGTVLAVCDTRYVARNARLGFQPDTTLASQGTFEYPCPGYFVHVIRVQNAWRLQNAALDARAKINGYRDRPVGEDFLTYENLRLRLLWDLRLSKLAQPKPRTAEAVAELDAGSLVWTHTA